MGVNIKKRKGDTQEVILIIGERDKGLELRKWQ